MSKVRRVLFLAMVLTFVSCEKEEPLYDFTAKPIVSTQMEIEMGENYTTQTYVRFSDSSTASNDFKVWDIALPSDITKLNVRINDANYAQLTTSARDNMDEIEAVPVSGWFIDNSCGDKDSCAIGDWYTEKNGEILSKQLVYLIDRGESTPGSRYFKFQIISFDGNIYKVAFGIHNSSEFVIKEIIINPDKNYNYLNLNTGILQHIEPLHKEEWDIVFKPYRHLFLDETPPLPYVVVGALINPLNVVVNQCTTVKYDDIDLDYALTPIEYSNDWDVIGFDWKEFDRNTNKYSINPNLSYIIKNSKGVYYKLRFISFYNKFGIKGYPRFEFKQL